jgi:hypothetical protein
MTKEVLKKMYQLLLTEPHAPTLCDQLESIAREALSKPTSGDYAIGYAKGFNDALQKAKYAELQTLALIPLKSL